MGLFNDPFVLGEVIGFGVGSAVVTYIVAKKLLPQRRTGAVARLMKNAGVEDSGAEKRSRWVPPPSLVAAVVAPLATLGYVGTKVKSFGASDVSELRRGFTEGCMRSCVKEGGEQPLCKDFCACNLAELAKRSVDDEAFAQWFSEAQRDPAKMKELGEIQELCVARVTPEQAP